jgi:hypothetical protein
MWHMNHLSCTLLITFNKCFICSIVSIVVLPSTNLLIINYASSTIHSMNFCIIDYSTTTEKACCCYMYYLKAVLTFLTASNIY